MSMGWTNLSEETPVARKDYRCYLCGLLIPRGTKHVKRVGVCDGEFYSDRMHEQCVDATASWDTDDWEVHDPWVFRNEVLAPEVLAEI